MCREREREREREMTRIRKGHHNNRIVTMTNEGDEIEYTGER